jgi:hypothetical protein
MTMMMSDIVGNVTAAAVAAAGLPPPLLPLL